MESHECRFRDPCLVTPWRLAAGEVTLTGARARGSRRNGIGRNGLQWGYEKDTVCGIITAGKQIYAEDVRNAIQFESGLCTRRR